MPIRIYLEIIFKKYIFIYFEKMEFTINFLRKKIFLPTCVLSGIIDLMIKGLIDRLESDLIRFTLKLTKTIANYPFV